MTTEQYLQRIKPNVEKDANPIEQKFPIGTRVHIADKSQSHGAGGMDATVVYTYKQAFDCGDYKSYWLKIVDDNGPLELGWFDEDELTKI